LAYLPRFSQQQQASAANEKDRSNLWTCTTNSLVVRTLSPHWSAGPKLGAKYSNLPNQDLTLR